MGLNPRGRGRGRGGGGKAKGRRGGGMMGHGPMFRPGPPGMFCPPPMGFPPEPPFGGPIFGGPSNFNNGPPRPAFGKFPRKNFKRKVMPKTNEAPAPDIDLTKPWVTEEIKSEEAKKQECLEMWRKTKSEEDWSKYKAQKQTVQSLYDKAKEESSNVASHPEEAGMWLGETSEGKYYCETCDKSFGGEDDLLMHEAEHEICGREGCEFTAHPKIIAKHKRMQHDSGLYTRIGKLYTEEDIAKWIEERKKRYPSRKVIEEKKALEEEQIKRGERIKDNDSKFNKTFQRKSRKSNIFEGKTPKTQKNRRTRKKNKNRTVRQDFETGEEEIPSVRKGVPAFIGIKKELEPEEPVENKEEGFDISDDEWEESSKVTSSPKPLLNNSLGLLAACYDSDVETPGGESHTKKAAEDSGSEGSAEGPEEVKTVSRKHPLPQEEQSEQNKVSKRRKFGREKEVPGRNEKTKSADNSTGRRTLTLLEKLLRKEIRHERNVILQCVHYVVKNNFFNV